jgi:hypothetical protein
MRAFSLCYTSLFLGSCFEKGSRGCLVPSCTWQSLVSLATWECIGITLTPQLSFIICRCALMVFWTWGQVSHRRDVVSRLEPDHTRQPDYQELEHKFDRANARNLNGLVFNSPPEDDEREKLENKAIAGESIEEVGRDVTILASSVAAVRRGAKDIACDSKGSFTIKRADGTALELQRTSTLAIFYKSAGGKGVPHAFSTFLHQVPALPRVVVSGHSHSSYQFQSSRSRSTHGRSSCQPGRLLLLVSSWRTVT